MSELTAQDLALEPDVVGHRVRLIRRTTLLLAALLALLLLIGSPAIAQKGGHVGGHKSSSSSSKSSSKSGSGKTVHVKGYTRKDGTYVPPYDSIRTRQRIKFNGIDITC
jgi:uncharacterized membrane protein